VLFEARHGPDTDDRAQRVGDHRSRLGHMVYCQHQRGAQRSGKRQGAHQQPRPMSKLQTRSLAVTLRVNALLRIALH
jgi:hypothetical protein